MRPDHKIFVGGGGIRFGGGKGWGNAYNLRKRAGERDRVIMDVDRAIVRGKRKRV